MALPPWVRVQAPTVIDATLKVDEGEREAICLAREVKAAALLLDDRRGRAAAVRYGLRVTGTVGLLEAAAARGLIDLPSAIRKLRETNARLDEDVLTSALARDRQRARGGRP